MLPMLFVCCLWFIVSMFSQCLIGIVIVSSAISQRDHNIIIEKIYHFFANVFVNIFELKYKCFSPVEFFTSCLLMDNICQWKCFRLISLVLIRWNIFDSDSKLYLGQSQRKQQPNIYFQFSFQTWYLLKTLHQHIFYHLPKENE